jgi:hypothetical protein
MENFILIRNIIKQQKIVCSLPNKEETKPLKIFNQINILDYIINCLLLLNNSNDNKLDDSDYKTYIRVTLNNYNKILENKTNKNDTLKMIEQILKINKIDYIIFLAKEFLFSLSEDYYIENKKHKNKLDEIEYLLEQCLFNVIEKKDDKEEIIIKEKHNVKFQKILNKLETLMKIFFSENEKIEIPIENNNSYLLNQNDNKIEYQVGGMNLTCILDDILLKSFFILSSLYQKNTTF